MNPTRIRATAWRSYDALDLTLTPGCLALIGANGAGKSSAIEALPVCLFGPAHGRTLAPYLNDQGDADTVEVEVELEHGGKRYRVRRSYSAAGRGKSSLDFEYWSLISKEWEPRTRETAAATQEDIEATLGLSQATFLASSYLRQGDANTFAESDPRDRKRVLAEVLQLDLYDRLLDLARAHRKAAEADLWVVKGATDAARSVAATRPETEQSVQYLAEQELLARDALSAAESTLKVLSERYEAARDAQAKRQAAEAELRASESELRRLEGERDSAIRVARMEYQKAAGELATAQHDHRVLTERRDSLTAQCESLDEKIAALKTEPEPTCFACGQIVQDEAHSRALASLMQEWDGATVLLDDVKQQVEALAPQAEVEITEPTEADLLAAVPEELRVKIGLADAALSTARELLTAKPTVSADALAQEAMQVRDKVALAHDGLARAQSAKAVAASQLETISEAEAKLEELAGREADLQRELDILLALEKVCGRDGIPALLVESLAVPSIETEANRILAELPTADGTVFRVRLETQRPTKDGDHLRDTLDIVVEGPNGARDYSTFSGGERARLSIALRLALARLLAHRKGAESRVLCLDEPADLDDAGMLALADVLRGLVGEFTSIVLVSHVPALREAFDNAIEVVKEDGVSRIVGAEVVEAVAV